MHRLYRFCVARLRGYGKGPNAIGPINASPDTTSRLLKPPRHIQSIANTWSVGLSLLSLWAATFCISVLFHRTYDYGAYIPYLAFGFLSLLAAFFAVRGRRPDFLAVAILIPSTVVAVLGIVIGLQRLVDVVQYHMYHSPTANNFRNGIFNMHQYLDKNAGFPASAVYDKHDKALLSWRVKLLGIFSEPNDPGHKLFQRFDIGQCWDSPQNIELLHAMPVGYRILDRAEQNDSETFFQVFVGKVTAFEGTKGLDPKTDFPDGLANTIFIAEARTAVPWSSPADLEYDADKPLPLLGQARGKGSWVALGDGSVRFLKNTVSETTVRALITRNGGKKIGSDW